MAVGDWWLFSPILYNLFTIVECVCLCHIRQHWKIYIRSIVCDPGLRVIQMSFYRGNIVKVGGYHNS